MVSKIFYKTLYILVIISLVGCELYYLPPHIQTPSHKKKGDIALNVQGLYSGSASASYAFHDNLFLGMSYMGYTSTSADSAVNDYFRVSTIEGGFFDYDEQSNIHLQISSGFGKGRVGDPSTGFEADFDRFYIQPSIGFITTNNTFENHLTMRISSIHYKRQQFQNIDPFTVQFVEPTYTFRAGSENVKFQMQLGLSIPVTDLGTRPVEFFYDPFIIGVGIHTNLNVFKKGPMQ